MWQGYYQQTIIAYAEVQGNLVIALIDNSIHASATVYRMSYDGAFIIGKCVL